MKVYGVIGWKNSGKTGLMERLVAEITARGFTVSTVKHVHHDVDLDQPGKDTWRHRQAGASEVVLAGAQRFAILHEHRGAEPELAGVLARMKPVDLVLVEGYKRDPHPKIEVWRRETGHELIQTHDPLVRAVATDAALTLPVPVLDLNDTGAVADFVLAETGLAAQRFETVVVVDWSAASAPSPARPSADAIWIGVAGAAGVSTSYHRTRAAAEAALRDLLADEAAAGRRVLAGFDFALGYPAGFAARLTGRPDARALWAWMADTVTDDAANRNNRFAVAAAVNRRFGGAGPNGGPFWGRPAALDLPDLPATKAVDYAALGLAERRQVERAVPGAQPVWKLYTTGSVGSQVLTGLPLVHRLAQGTGVAVWPFDPPHSVAAARVVLAEIYPSLIARAVAREGGVKDAAQVRLLALALWRVSQAGGLAAMMRLPDGVPPDEGWILGAGHAATLLAALEQG